LARVEVPDDLNDVLDEAWEAARKIPGFLTENEARFLGMVVACTPGTGAIVEIGSFKGKSTVMLAKVAQHYGLGSIAAIDPHNFNNEELHKHRDVPGASTYDDFLSNIRLAGVSASVEPYRAFSVDVAATWGAPIRFLWIDGDHTYRGAKADFDGFARHVVPGGVVALHDALHEFSGPIRVFVEEMLRPERFGAAGFVGSIAWDQLRPEDGALFKAERTRLEGLAAPLIPFVKDEGALHGLRRLGFKLRRARVPRSLISSAEWAELLNRAENPTGRDRPDGD
jgi:MMP 1-O-methyltransferase